MNSTSGRALTAVDHRNGHHGGRDRSCWRCSVRAWLGRTPKPQRPTEDVQPGACGDPKCPVLHADPANPIHPPWWIDSREEVSGG